LTVATRWLLFAAMSERPLTGSIRPAVVALMECYAPVHAADHLVQAWAALAAVERGEKVAANRLACAKSEPVARAVKSRSRKAYSAECASLDAAIRKYIVSAYGLTVATERLRF
jgi:hypothetical protein